MSTIKKIFLVIMLALLPFLSWVFLKDGFNYRAEALKELERKAPLTDSLLTADVLPALLGHVTVVALTGSDEIQGLLEQFGKVEAFQLFALQKDGSNNPPEGVQPISPQAAEALINDLGAADTPVFILLDEEGNIRKSYTGKEEMPDLVRHVATLLPFVDKKKKRDE